MYAKGKMEIFFYGLFVSPASFFLLLPSLSLSLSLSLVHLDKADHNNISIW